MNIKLTEERLEEIKKEVAKMFKDCNINCVPINGFEIASKKGIKVYPYSCKSEKVREKCLQESEDGFSIFKDNQWYIFYNDEKGFGRINNTMLHEIGHIVLDHTEDSELADKEAKFFAKYALVPPVLVHKFKLKTIDEIVEVFDVSYEAAKYALIYYHKWLNYGFKEYTQYEENILALFNSNRLEISFT